MIETTYAAPSIEEVTVSDPQAARFRTVVFRSALLPTVIGARGAAAAGLVGYWPLDGGHKTAGGGPKAAAAPSGAG